MRCAALLLIVAVAGGSRLTSLGSIFEGLYTDKIQVASAAESSSSRYGVDKSFPMHYPADMTVDNPLGGMEKRNLYNEFINGCREYYAPDGHLCDITEEERIQMNINQPVGMVNYTELGFAKVHAPDELNKLLTRFWKRNFRSPQNIPNETWSRGNTYTNHWSSPSKMLQMEVLPDGGEELRTKVWDISRDILESWTGVELSPSSLYGVRVYTDGAVLAPHVDRMPLVISAIVNVAQDVDEEWPLEVIGHDGTAHNLTLEPGQMILYESHSIIHGRPFPLQGRYYANVFIHFEPLGHSIKNEQTAKVDLSTLYQQAWEKQNSECSKDDYNDCKLQIDFNMEKVKTPAYILPGSEEEKRWLQAHSHAKLANTKERTRKVVDNLGANFAAAAGDLTLLKRIVKGDPKSLYRVDNNGWSPLTEAARGGHQEVMEWLLQEGANINQRTHKGKGGSPLWWAKKFLGSKHKIVEYMEERGAVEIPPSGHGKIKS